MANKPKFVGVDFDGTCVTHEYPNIGNDIGAQLVLKRIIDSGNKLILITMRSGKELDDAIVWFCENDIELYSVNQNPTQKSWTLSPKIYAHTYIDDAALGCPLVKEGHPRPYVDWMEVETMLIEEGFINDNRNSTKTLF